RPATGVEIAPPLVAESTGEGLSVERRTHVGRNAAPAADDVLLPSRRGAGTIHVAVVIRVDVVAPVGDTVSGARPVREPPVHVAGLPRVRFPVHAVRAACHNTGP